MPDHMKIRALILAAGKGTRMQSDLPKVLHQLWGETLIGRIISRVKELGPQDIGIVVSPQNKDALARVLGDEIELIVQDRQKGTGDAVMAAAGWCADFDGNLLVMVGDAPLIRTATLRQLLAEQCRQKGGVSFATAVFDDPPPWGRVIRDAAGNVLRIVEEKDATDSEKQIREVSSSHYCFNARDLFRLLPRIDCRNQQGEYYLPDVVGLMAAEGLPVRTVRVADPMELFGVNTPADLQRMDNLLKTRPQKWSH